jgi:NADH:flavin oxidoreductase / NADH oxidase family
VPDGANNGCEAARPKLFQPFTIRGLTLKNRLVVPPMVHFRCDPGHTCGIFHLVHLGRYSLGGFGLVFVEATAVEEVGLINENDLGIWNDAQAESFRPLIALMRGRRISLRWLSELFLRRSRPKPFLNETRLISSRLAASRSLTPISHITGPTISALTANSRTGHRSTAGGLR